MIKEVMYIATEKSEEIYQLLKKFEFWKVIRVTSWIYRFLENIKCKEKFSGPVKTNETEKTKVFWITLEQEKLQITDNFKEDQGWLNLQKIAAGIYECRGRIQGHYPIYIPRKSLLAEKITYKAHNASACHINNGSYQGKLLDS